MIYSFDIFDTCLIRTCGLPYFAFEILARRVMPNADETQRYNMTPPKCKSFGSFDSIFNII